MTIGWGTHGGGLQFKTIQVFKMTSSKLQRCKSCIQDSDVLIIEYPRSKNINLHFDSKTNKISYEEFRPDNETGTYIQTGKTITLKLINGAFISE